MALYLGIDGGGTGCRAAVADPAGRVLGRAEAGPANVASDREGALAAILTAARAALAAAGLAETPLGSLTAGLGLAGTNAAGTTEWLLARLPFAGSSIATDAATAVKGALGTADGMVAAVGTGSVFASQRGGAIRQIGGKGLILGDEGSGGWLGRRLLSRTLRAADCYQGTPMTPLLRAVLAEFGGEAGVIGFAAMATPAEFAALVPRLTGSPDPAAQALLAEGSAEIAAALKVLSQDHRPALDRAVFLGGLGPVYARLLAPRWHSVPPLGTALDGALMLARGL